jgi:hypothetical protein
VGELFEKCVSKLQVSASQKLLSLHAVMRANPVRYSVSNGVLPTVVRGTRVEQPKDGSCLFHSIAWGVGDIHRCDTLSPGMQLRREIAAFIKSHPREQIANTAIEDWVQMISDQSAHAYAETLAYSDTWGGDLELAIATIIKDIRINVYERHEQEGNFRCIARFGPCDSAMSPRIVSVVYSKKPCRHYDALLVHDVD